MYSCNRQRRTPISSSLVPILLTCSALAALPHPLEAQEASDNTQLRLATSIVKGLDRDGVFTYDADALDRQALSDISRILLTRPGVRVREEDGFGLRPNISIRGTDPTRSAKITVLEDDIPIAPAPYAAPSAYYFPRPARMDSISVVTGPDVLKYGPNTLGGVVHMTSTPIPGMMRATLRSQGGSHDATRILAAAGGQRTRSSVRLGALAEIMSDRAGGFKKIDGRGDGGTGFQVTDYLGKLTVGAVPGIGLNWEARAKIHLSDQRSDETYTGLSAGDFTATPYRRYAGSAADRFDSRHWQIATGLRLSQQLWKADFLLYRTNFHRNWYKLERVDPDGTSLDSGRAGSVSISSVLSDPLANVVALDIVRGTTSPDGALLLRNNNRSYFAEGARAEFTVEQQLAGAHHSIEARLRWHRDGVDRLQSYDRYSMNRGSLVLFGRDQTGSESNRLSKADALSGVITDRIAFGKWALTPTARFETIRTRRERYDANDPDRSSMPTQIRTNAFSVILPGLSARYEPIAGLALLLSAHRGFSPPGPGATDDIEPEAATNYEAAVSWTNGKFVARTHVFFNDYDNLLGSCTVAAATDTCEPGDQFNGGRVGVFGIEAGIEGKWEIPGGLAFPVRLSYSRIEASFQTSFESDFSSWGNVSKGDRLPYIADDHWSFDIGLDAGDLRIHALSAWTGPTRTHAGSGPIPGNRLIEAHLTVDLAASWQFNAATRLNFRVRNLLDTVYLAARHPAGLRPGLPRQILVGLDIAY